MTVRNFIGYFMLIIFSLACNRLEDKAKQVGGKVKEKSKHLIGTVIRKLLSDPKPEPASIRHSVTDFKNDTSITELQGIRIEVAFLYTDYYVYRGQKNRVLSGIDKIIAEKKSDYRSDDKCYLVSAKTFYTDSSPYEKNQTNAFFWHFEQLKDYEIYTCIKAPFRHYIIFDKNSDTVYHRIDEIRD